jgi:hypothetical protein
MVQVHHPERQQNRQRTPKIKEERIKAAGNMNRKGAWLVKGIVFI